MLFANLCCQPSISNNGVKGIVIGDNKNSRAEVLTDMIPIIVQQIPYPLGASLFFNTLIGDSKSLLKTIATVDNIDYFKK